MPGAANKFALEIDRDLASSLDDIRDIVVMLGLEGITRIVNRTPVDTGRARGNWSVSISSRDTTVSVDADPSGSGAINAGVSAVQSYPEEGWPSLFIQNNLPYIERLEDGYSGQAPNGMVALTHSELVALSR